MDSTSMRWWEYLVFTNVAVAAVKAKDTSLMVQPERQTSSVSLASEPRPSEISFSSVVAAVTSRSDDDVRSQAVRDINSFFNI